MCPSLGLLSLDKWWLVCWTCAFSPEKWSHHNHSVVRVKDEGYSLKVWAATACSNIYVVMKRRWYQKWRWCLLIRYNNWFRSCDLQHLPWLMILGGLAQCFTKEPDELWNNDIAVKDSLVMSSKSGKWWLHFSDVSKGNAIKQPCWIFLTYSLFNYRLQRSFSFSRCIIRPVRSVDYTWRQRESTVLFTAHMGKIRPWGPQRNKTNSKKSIRGNVLMNHKVNDYIGCSSGGRAGRLLIGRSLGPPQLHVEVSLSKTLNPKLLQMNSWHLAWQPPPSVYECVCEWVNVASIVKCFERSVDWKSSIKMQDHLPYIQCCIWSWELV